MSRNERKTQVPLWVVKGGGRGVVRQRSMNFGAASQSRAPREAGAQTGRERAVRHAGRAEWPGEVERRWGRARPGCGWLVAFLCGIGRFVAQAVPSVAGEWPG